MSFIHRTLVKPFFEVFIHSFKPEYRGDFSPNIVLKCFRVGACHYAISECLLWRPRLSEGVRSRFPVEGDVGWFVFIEMLERANENFWNGFASVSWMKGEIYQIPFLKLSILKLPYCVVCEKLKKLIFKGLLFFILTLFH